MEAPRTLFEKLWARHVVVHQPGSEDLLYVDCNLINEGGAFLGFDQLRIEGRKVRRPSQNIAVTDHYLPTTDRTGGPSVIPNADIRRVVEMHGRNAREFGLEHIDMHDPRQGIAHVIGPELGLAQPGLLISCNDSHTATKVSGAGFTFQPKK